MDLNYDIQDLKRDFYYICTEVHFRYVSIFVFELLPLFNFKEEGHITEESPHLVQKNSLSWV